MNAEQASRIRKGVNFGQAYVRRIEGDRPLSAVHMFALADAAIGRNKLAWRAYERTVERGWKKWINSAPTNEEGIRRIDIMMEILDEELLLIGAHCK